MTKHEFIKAYCEGLGEAWDDVKKTRSPMPCACEEPGCDGWAMVRQNPDSLEHYWQFDAPKATLRD